MTLKPWREVAIPHEDVLKGTFQQAEFAADLSRVHAGSATEEYQNPAYFFERTYITEGMRLLLGSVAKRITGQGGDPVIQLQTAFGGGKTHTMLAVYHLAKGEVPASELQGISAILDAAGITELPKARLVVLDGINLDPSKPSKRNGHEIRTLWGELAWQLGGATAFDQIKESDANGTSPAKDTLSQLLKEHAPCVILMDELVAYLRQFDEGKRYPAGTFDSNLTFIQSLTEALKSVPNAILLASLPESKLEVGSARAEAALDALEKYFGRVQAIWKPVATEEAFEIVRRRLFVRFSDPKAMDEVCRAFADTYIQNDGEFPHETIEGRYFDRLKNAYPIHPEVFDRLYEDWSTLDKFQRTRGVLKLMAKVIHRLWKDNNTDLLVMPGSIPLYDSDVRNEAIYYLPQGWDPVLERDIDGEKAETTVNIDNEGRFGSVQAARRAARTIFLGSAPTTGGQMVRGIELERVILGCVQPGQQVAVFKDALKRLTDRLHYLNSGNSRFWFDTRPNLRREMEDRKRRFQDREDVSPLVKQQLQVLLRGGVFSSHIFAQSGDVPDDSSLRLVVLGLDAGYLKATASIAVEKATEILKGRGDQPRLRQNRLLFLAADSDSLARLRDQVRSVLAWQSINADIKELRLNLDQYQTRQAQKNEEDTKQALVRMVRETYRWLLVPIQEERLGKGLSEIIWEPIALSSGSQNLVKEVELRLRENELLISEWAPIHLANLLKNWFWKEPQHNAGALEVWQKCCNYLYLPRLRDEETFKKTLAIGASSKDFFGLAYGKDANGYLGLTLGNETIPILDASLLLVEPSVALEQLVQKAAAEAVKIPTNPDAQPGSVSEATGTVSPFPTKLGVFSTKPGSMPVESLQVKRSFYGTVELDPIKAKLAFAEIVDEVVQKFSARHDVKVSLHIELRAETASAFDDKIQRDVKENCSVLKFKNAEFE
ncbi:MAG: ATP-binding protein [Vampirovibrio sp.]|nr:ATP-binding protein [Vampirovibrio sp.]